MDFEEKISYDAFIQKCMEQYSIVDESMKDTIKNVAFAGAATFPLLFSQPSYGNAFDARNTQVSRQLFAAENTETYAECKRLILEYVDAIRTYTNSNVSVDKWVNGVDDESVRMDYTFQNEYNASAYKKHCFLISNKKYNMEKTKFHRAYKDSRGINTVYAGINLEEGANLDLLQNKVNLEYADGKRTYLKHPLVLDKNKKPTNNVRLGVYFRDELCSSVFKDIYRKTEEFVKNSFAPFTNDMLMVMTDLVYNMGVSNLLEFKNFLKGFELDNEYIMLIELRDSKYFKQVGYRSSRNQKIIIHCLDQKSDEEKDELLDQCIRHCGGPEKTENGK